MSCFPTLVVVQFGDRRVLVPRPTTYEGAISAARAELTALTAASNEDVVLFADVGELTSNSTLGRAELTPRSFPAAIADPSLKTIHVQIRGNPAPLPPVMPMSPPRPSNTAAISILAPPPLPDLNRTRLVSL